MSFLKLDQNTDVLIVVPEYPLGGAERQAFELVRNNKMAGFSIVDVKSTCAHRIEESVDIYGFDLDILALNIKNKFYRRLVRYFRLIKLYVILRKTKVGILVFYNPVFLMMATILGLSDKKIVFSIRECLAELFCGVNKQLIKRIDVLFTNTPSVKKLLDKENIECKLLLNTIDFDVESTDVSKRVANTVLVISNVEPHKKIDLLIKATSDLHLNIRICGRLENEDYARYCKKLADTSLCNIEFLGSVSKDRLKDELLSCELLAHPSSLEGTSNAILDAIKYKTPLIVSSIPENTYLVDENESFIFQNDDVVSLRCKLLQTQKECLSVEYKSQQDSLLKSAVNKFSRKNLTRISELLQNDN